MNKNQRLDKRSLEIRLKIVNMMIAANRGHLLSALSLVEILRVLYDDILQFRSGEPDWTDRDRFILSKGHGCLALYAILAEKGFFPEDELLKFCKRDGILGGHPEKSKIPGVEASTGSLGHGLSIGIGFALNARLERKAYHTYVVLGDGETNEGSIWEAALCASKHKLSNLTVLIDYNKQQSYDSTFDVLDLEPISDKWNSFGFSTVEVDGHDIKELGSHLGRLPFESDRPSAIICHTIKGKGIPHIEKDLTWHHKSNLKEKDIEALLAPLGGNL
jgi:transketolase